MKLERILAKDLGIRKHKRFLSRDENGSSSLVKTLALGVGASVVGLAASVPLYLAGEQTIELVEGYMEHEARKDANHRPEILKDSVYFDWDINGERSVYLTVDANVYDEDGVDDIDKVEFIVVRTLWFDKKFEMEREDILSNETASYNIRLTPNDYGFKAPRDGKDYTLKIKATDKLGAWQSLEYEYTIWYRPAPGFELPAAVVSLIAAVGLGKYFRRKKEERDGNL